MIDKDKMAIEANIAALEYRLDHAATEAQIAAAAMANGQQNLAIGTLMQIEPMLTEALALFSAAMALHRAR